jgi:glycosyltransferase involved in cell wall biosynthesis
MQGFSGWVTKKCDWLITKLNTQCYADSFSQREFLLEQDISTPENIKVLGNGSFAGVDRSIFNKSILHYKSEYRNSIDISKDAKVISFIGRVNRDKGIVELTHAFLELYMEDAGYHLILAGPFEPDLDPLPRDILNTIREHSNIHVIGYTDNPEKYLAMSDIFCLPSYREGFGSIVIEAAAIGIPCVATRIVGLVDAVIDGETGLLVPPKDAGALSSALRALMNNDELRVSMGESAEIRAARLFDSNIVNTNLMDEYKLLKAKFIDKQ